MSSSLCAAGLIATQWHFQRQADIPEYRSSVCGPDICYAPRGNGWARVPVAGAPGFGIPVRARPLDTIPVRNFGGRTAALVRSVLRRCFGHVFWRVRWDVVVGVPGATLIERGWRHSAVAISAPRSLGARGSGSPAIWHRATPSSPVLDRSSRPPLRGPLPSRGWI